MTPVSMWKMEKEDEDKIIQVLVYELAKINSGFEMNKLLGFLLSKSEKIMIAKRIFVFVMIEQGGSDMEIAKKLHMTRATVQRLRMGYELQLSSDKGVKDTVKGFEDSELIKELMKKFMKYFLPAMMGRIPR